MPFTTSLYAEELDADNWRLMRDLVYECNAMDSRIVVPKGFVTDFGSVPWWLRWLLKPRRWRKPAGLHDYLYGQGGGRFLADALLRHAMSEEGVPLWRRFLVFKGLRYFGASHYTEKDN